MNLLTRVLYNIGMSFVAVGIALGCFMLTFMAFGYGASLLGLIYNT